MSTFKFITSIIGFSILVLAVSVGLSFAVNGVLVWQLYLAVVPAALLLGLIITVIIDKPLERT